MVVHMVVHFSRLCTQCILYCKTSWHTQLERNFSFNIHIWKKSRIRMKKVCLWTYQHGLSFFCSQLILSLIFHFFHFWYSVSPFVFWYFSYFNFFLFCYFYFYFSNDHDHFVRLCVLISPFIFLNACYLSSLYSTYIYYTLIRSYFA